MFVFNFRIYSSYKMANVIEDIDSTLSDNFDDEEADGTYEITKNDKINEKMDMAEDQSQNNRRRVSVLYSNRMNN